MVDTRRVVRLCVVAAAVDQTKVVLMSIKTEFELVPDVNGRPVARWQQKLQQMSIDNVPFGEVLSYVRWLLTATDQEKREMGVGVLIGGIDFEILQRVTPLAEALLSAGMDTDTLLERMMGL